MSRISRVDVCDYRAFPGPAVAEFHLRGAKRHLLLYGENGSGKSSLGRAFKDFFSGISKPEFKDVRNTFTKPSSFKKGRVELHFADGPAPPLLWTLSSGRDGTHPLFRALCATLAWLDYAEVRRIYDLDRLAMIRDLFPLCREILLRDVPMPARLERFGREWDNLEVDITKPRGRGLSAKANLDKLNRRVDQYNKSLVGFLDEWQKEATALLSDFTKQTELFLNVTHLAGIATGRRGTELLKPRIGLRIQYRGHEPNNPEAFLNEARLTACALSLWLAALLRSRPLLLGIADTYPRVLILDDVLLGLDMEHRRPLLKVLKKHFAEWQIFLLTHSRAWYEVAKQRLPENSWQYSEVFAVTVGDYESPVVQADEEHLYRALRYLEPNTAIGEPLDVKAAAVHVRTKFELLLKEYCERLHVPVPFHRDLRKINAGTFWDALRAHRMTLLRPGRIFRNKEGRAVLSKPRLTEVEVLPKDLVDRVSHALSWVLNPLSHSESVDRYRCEIFDGIFAIDELEKQLRLAASGRMPDPLFARDQLMDVLVGPQRQLMNMLRTRSIAK